MCNCHALAEYAERNQILASGSGCKYNPTRFLRAREATSGRAARKRTNHAENRLLLEPVMQQLKA